MGRKRRVLRVAVTFAIAAATIVVAAPSSQASIRNANETQLLGLINNKRASQGKSVLVKHAFILGQVRAHSVDMANRLTMDHLGVDGRFSAIQNDDNGIDPGGHICENVVYAQWSPPSYIPDEDVPQMFYNQWFNSPPHKKCMLDKIANSESAAVGLAKRVVGDTVYWYGTFITAHDTTP